MVDLKLHFSSAVERTLAFAIQQVKIFDVAAHALSQVPPCVILHTPIHVIKVTWATDDRSKSVPSPIILSSNSRVYYDMIYMYENKIYQSIVAKICLIICANILQDLFEFDARGGRRVLQ